MSAPEDNTDQGSSLLDLLQLIKKIERTAALHQAAEKPDPIAVEQYDSLRERYTAEFLQLLKQEYGLELQPATQNGSQAA
jgi:nicotinic acid mononucleotide adenylyltransferase